MKRRTMMIILAAALLALPVVALAQVEDFLPSVRIGGPDINPTSVTFVTRTVTFTFTGSDPDSPEALPTKFRYLLIPAMVGPMIINTKSLYDQYVDELVDFADSTWTVWIDYPPDQEERQITFHDLFDQEYFLLAMQSMDADGAVSLGRGYGLEVVNFQVRSDLFQLQVVLNEYFLGTTTISRTTEIASGQPLNFSWIASADTYGGSIVSYRHGFDLVDPDDPNDPGWSVAPGTNPYNLYSEERSFSEGEHAFFLRVVDDLDQVGMVYWILNVIPNISPENQYPLLLIDQVVDNQSNAWPGEGGTPAYDNQGYRNAYWQFLEGTGGVADFNWDRDRFDHADIVNYSDLVWYRAVLMYSRSHSQQLLFNQFRPVNNVDKYVWLTPYQTQGGNLLMVGSQSMESFLETQNYMVPIIFDTTEEYYSLFDTTYVVGFGTTILPDGSEYLRGPRQYPYATAGASLLDWAVPLDKHIYARRSLASEDRKSSCAALKEIVLDPVFKVNHQIGQGAIADTIGTNALIDWRDEAPYTLDTAFPFIGDEFVDANISSRTTPWSPQECADGPDGLCVEPMFSGVSRFDWVREKRWAAGDAGWPNSQYSPEMLEDICGPMALTSLEDLPQGTALTNGLTYGYLSYKNVADKPSGKADAYWGFDPYRFDHLQSQNAIRWVLDYFGLPLNR